MPPDPTSATEPDDRERREEFLVRIAGLLHAARGMATRPRRRVGNDPRAIAGAPCRERRSLARLLIQHG